MSAPAPLSLDLQRPSAVEPPRDEGWPPPPHDPRERDLALLVAGWEVRGALHRPRGAGPPPVLHLRFA